ncbi:MAG: helix-turn-helix transcriptional regulator [Butyrivibrio sp.]|nr:helix-turn-helix transcriptional regulator [Butyrivibrio sp.]
MKKNLRSQFNSRQYMLSQDYEIYYYSNVGFKAVPEHSHDYYEFYFFIEGDISMVINGKEYNVSPSDVIIVPPGIKHHAIIHDSLIPYRRFVFWISKDYCDALLKRSPYYIYSMQHVITTKHYIYHFDLLSFSSIQTLIFEILDEIHSDNYGKEAYISSCVERFLLKLNRLIYNMENSKTYEDSSNTYSLIAAYIDAHLDEDLTLDDLASEFYLSKFHISHLFKENIGISVHQFITKKRLALVSADILSGTNISKTFDKYGFKDYSSFYRAFKKEYHLSPSEYKEQMSYGDGVRGS